MANVSRSFSCCLKDVNFISKAMGEGEEIDRGIALQGNSRCMETGDWEVSEGTFALI